MGNLLVADRSERGMLRFSGRQDLWFLHQILTQAFEDMAPGDARDAAMITAHGRMVGYLECLRTEDAVLAHFEPSLRATLPDDIRRYVFATQVEIEDLNSSMGLVLVAGDGWEQAADQAAPGAPKHPTRSLGTGAGYLWLPAGEVAAVIAALEASGAQRAPEEELEAIRVRNGAPRWGYEMDTKTIPQEVGLDAWAVHYDKGCYVGQEAMAKIHFRGKPNKRLVRVEGELTVGEEVLVEGARVGTVTSVSNGMGLAVVKHTIEKGTLVEVNGNRAKVID